MKELKVGERVNITLEIVESNSCDGCFFDNFGGCIRGSFECIAGRRSDYKNVIFKEIKE